MIVPRHYQEKTIELIYEYFQTKNGNPLICYPTGTGKSLIPAIFIQRIMQRWPNQRFLLLTSIKELIEQNAEVLKLVWKDAPLGIFSAGLNKKQSYFPIVFAGIQSAIKSPVNFGHRDIIFIDEAHLVSDEDASQYLTFIATLKLINPKLKIIGMTATKFRMGMGLLTEGKLFTDVIHDLTGLNEFNELIAEGFLCPLVPRRTKTELDVSNVGIAKGDFIASQVQTAVDKQEITYNALRETVEAGYNRRSWLIFSSGIEHSDHIAAMLGTFGVECASVHSKQSSEYNDMAIKAFKENRLRAISCYSKLTTGFNHPHIDMICDLRPTMSIPLHIQKLGRGTRPANGKENCVVLDFGRNVPRLGPINDPIIPRKKGEKGGEVPIKICEECGTYNHAKVRYCTNCGHEFQFQIKIVPKSGTDEILVKSDLPVIETFQVDKAIYTKQPAKYEKPPYIKATYFCGLRTFSENVFPEHHVLGGKSAYTQKLFKDWWMQRNPNPPPTTTNEALEYVSMLRCPKTIRVWCNLQFPRIMGVEF